MLLGAHTNILNFLVATLALKLVELEVAARGFLREAPAITCTYVCSLVSLSIHHICGVGGRTRVLTLRERESEKKRNRLTEEVKAKEEDTDEVVIIKTVIVTGATPHYSISHHIIPHDINSMLSQIDQHLERKEGQGFFRSSDRHHIRIETMTHLRSSAPLCTTTPC